MSNAKISKFEDVRLEVSEEELLDAIKQIWRKKGWEIETFKRVEISFLEDWITLNPSTEERNLAKITCKCDVYRISGEYSI